MGEGRISEGRATDGGTLPLKKPGRVGRVGDGQRKRKGDATREKRRLFGREVERTGVTEGWRNPVIITRAHQKRLVHP